MIQQDCFAQAHIRQLQEKSRRDPALLERAVYAFGLLEALARVGMPFIFKGGTCLMLLLEHPRRLSTDIDIIVEPGTDLDGFIAAAGKIFPFQSAQEQKRKGKNGIEKRHFKFSYDSPINGKPFYILLDVLFEKNHYAELVRKEIRNDLLLTEPEYLTVQIPSADCILADKLTAFAPHTTGIPLNAGKDMEVMKQFYDITTLIDLLSDLDRVIPTYNAIAKTELAYRGIDAFPQDCLWDTIRASLCIAGRGKLYGEEYPYYVKGARELRGHIYAENFTPESAAILAPRVLYLAACLLENHQYEKTEDPGAYINEPLATERLTPLKYLRKINPEAYSYVVKASQVLIHFDNEQ